ncbi:MAG: DUF4446 family protein [Syntrophomonadaceae bacterium]|nr:DUF4446 family protein [Syntrophomonadaceae bacterium]
MKELIPLINDYIILLHLALIIVVIVLCIIFWRRDKANKELLKFYSTLMESYDKGNLESILQQMLSKQEKNLKRLQVIEDRVADIEAQLPENIDRVAVHRYNAFPDVGGNLSFSVALLNRKGSGLVISGIYGRSETLIYAKEVQAFTSDHPLSNEELQAINIARNRGTPREKRQEKT